VGFLILLSDYMTPTIS